MINMTTQSAELNGIYDRATELAASPLAAGPLTLKQQKLLDWHIALGSSQTYAILMHHVLVEGNERAPSPMQVEANTDALYFQHGKIADEMETHSIGVPFASPADDDEIAD